MREKGFIERLTFILIGLAIWSDPLNLHKSDQTDQSVLRGVRG